MFLTDMKSLQMLQLTTVKKLNKIKSSHSVARFESVTKIFDEQTDVQGHS